MNFHFTFEQIKQQFLILLHDNKIICIVCGLGFSPISDIGRLHTEPQNNG